MSKKPLSSLYAIILYSAFTLSIVLLPSRAHAQAAAPPATPAAPAEPVVPAVTLIGENYHVELQVGAWFSIPSTAMYSDSEPVTATSGSTTTTTTVNGTNIDFKKNLGLTNQIFPEAHLTVRLIPRHKLRGDYIPMFYSQSTTLASDIVFNGQTYLTGQAVDSTLHVNQWKVAYEFDVLTSDRGYLGAMIAGSSLNISGAMANTVQSGTASVNILMPGLGATGRYYPAPKFSVTGEVFVFDLPGNATSTHGHIVQVDGYATFNINKHLGVQGGIRAFDSSHVWGSPLNTGSMMVLGPYVGGTAHF